MGPRVAPDKALRHEGDNNLIQTSKHLDYKNRLKMCLPYHPLVQQQTRGGARAEVNEPSVKVKREPKA